MSSRGSEHQQPVFAAQIEAITTGLIERGAAAKAALLACLAGENVLLIGPPGTAKSFLARRIAQTFGGGYFEYLLTKFTTPDELFGPLSIAELKADRFWRKTEGYLPTATLAFLDEVFKASSSILNALLTLMNERVFHNGSARVTTPLRAVIGATNELPTGEEALAALYDRFLVRIFVDEVSEEGFSRLCLAEEAVPVAPLDPGQLADLDKAAQAVRVGPEIVAALAAMRRMHREAFQEDARERLSDRRLKKAIKLLRYAAASHGRAAVEPVDLLVLKDVLWSHPANAGQAREIVFAAVRAACAPPQEEAAEKVTAAPIAPRAPAPLGRVFKDYAGSGTAEDPIRIRDLHDLVGLERPQVGQQSHHFLLEADIDLSSLTTWPTLHFKGVFDGNGHTLKDANRSHFVFASLEQSRLTGLKLENLCLAKSASDSTFERCETITGNALVGSAQSCHFDACASGYRLIDVTATQCNISTCLVKDAIATNAESCRISRCQTQGGPLLWNGAKSCQISDCLVVLNGKRTSDCINVGGVAEVLSDGSQVERCYVTGRWLGYCRFSGIARVVDGSTVASCALGAFELKGRETAWYGRIAYEVRNQGKVADNNIALDSNTDTARYAGKPIAAALWTQRYFEHTLGWDFQQVWRWDAQENRPALIAVGVGASRHEQAAKAQAQLAEAIRSHLWL